MKRQNQFFITLLILILTLSGCKYLPSLGNEEKEERNNYQQVLVHFIDVGQGDAILIQLPARNILIDGGSRNSNVTNYIKEQGISKLDLIIATHPHEDHIGGLIRTLETFAVKEVIDPGFVHTSQTYHQFIAAIKENEFKFTIGRTGLIREFADSVYLRIIHPATLLPGRINDASVVAKFRYKQISFLFTGDAENSSEAKMIQDGHIIKSNVLKVGHHGSRTSTSQEFLDAVNPEIAVISCGLNNRYGHPHEITIQKLNNAAIEIFRTDLQGTIIITTDGYSISINKNPWRQSLSYYTSFNYESFCAA